MVEKFQVYKCNICGNTVSVLFAGGGELVCCGKPMENHQEKTADQGMEKHVPFVEKGEKRMTVKVGETAHPMVDDHYIMWIDTVSDDAESRKYLKPGEKPEKTFCVKKDLKKIRAYCNIHGLWKEDA